MCGDTTVLDAPAAPCPVCGSELAPGTTVCLACQGNKRGGAAAPGGAWNGRSCWSLLAGAFLMLGSVAVATRLMAPRK